MEQQVNNYTKPCPFCAEQIPAVAIKCRFCGEIFTPERLKLVERVLSANEQPPAADQDLLIIQPSLWVLASSAKKILLLFFVSLLLLIIPIEKPFKAKSPSSSTAIANQTTSSQNSSSFYLALRKFRITITLAVLVISASIIAQKVWRLRNISYCITAQRIEYSRGLFNKNIDNIDMFRIVDMKLRQSVFDRLTGTGTVIIYTTDKTDPEFHFEKVRNPGLLYDTIKKFSLDADKSGAVVHLE